MDIVKFSNPVSRSKLVPCGVLKHMMARLFVDHHSCFVDAPVLRILATRLKQAFASK
jgi:hypothetical protein